MTEAAADAARRTAEIERDARPGHANHVLWRVGWAVTTAALVASVLTLFVMNHYRGMAVDNLSNALIESNDQVRYCAVHPDQAYCRKPVASDPSQIITGPVGDTGPSVAAEHLGPAGAPTDAASHLARVLDGVTGRAVLDARSAPHDDSGATCGTWVMPASWCR